MLLTDYIKAQVQVFKNKRNLERDTERQTKLLPGERSETHFFPFQTQLSPPDAGMPLNCVYAHTLLSAVAWKPSSLPSWSDTAVA